MIAEYQNYTHEHPDLIPASLAEANERITRLLGITDLAFASPKCFLEGWWSLFWVHPGLHPDDFAVWDDEFHSYVPWAVEAFRRVSLGAMTESLCYPAEAAHRRIFLERTGAVLSAA